MAAAIRECGGLALGVEEQHDFFIQERKRPGTVLELADWHRSVPESPQHLLWRDEHVASFPRRVRWLPT